MPAELLCHRRRSAGAEEGVQHHASGRAACQQTGFRQLWRKSGEMPTPVRHGVDLPYVALVAKLRDLRRRIPVRAVVVDALMLLAGDVGGILVACAEAPPHPRGCGLRHRLRNGCGVVVVSAGLGQQENMLIAAGGAVCDALRHGVRLLPDDVRAQIPAVCAQRKGKQPRHADHVLCLAAPHLAVEGDRLPRPAVGVLGVEGFALIALSGIGVRDVQPEGAVRRENAPDLPENGNQALHIQRRRFLPPDLPVHAVIPQCVVRRRGYAAVHGTVRQGFQHGQGVAAVDAVSLHSRTHPLEAR